MSEGSIAQAVIADVGGAFVTGLGYIGDRLGLFKQVAEKGPAPSEQIAHTTGLEERYVREWLKAMVSAGYIERDPEEDRYWMTEEQREVLANEASPVFAAGAFQFALPSLLKTERLIDSFENGGGISYSELGSEIAEAIDRMHRPWFEHQLISQWLPAVPGLNERLGQGIRVLDVGSGLGRAAVALAEA
jgi:DNA-binding MarR family transcriptional regulator